MASEAGDMEELVYAVRMQDTDVYLCDDCSWVRGFNGAALFDSREEAQQWAADLSIPWSVCVVAWVSVTRGGASNAD